MPLLLKSLSLMFATQVFHTVFKRTRKSIARALQTCSLIYLMQFCGGRNAGIPRPENIYI